MGKPLKILFFVELLHSGGRERRMVELIKALSVKTDYILNLVIMDKDIHYKDIFDTRVNIHYLIRKSKKDWSVFFKFNKLRKKIKPDIVHVWGNMPAFYALPSCILSGTRLINNQVISAPETYPKGFEGFIHRVNFRFSKEIVSNTVAGLNAYKIKEIKRICIPNGYDFNRQKKLRNPEEIITELNLKDKLVVGMVASFNIFKDYKTYLESAKEIIQERNDVLFLCIGGGPDIEKFKSEYSQNNQIQFLGRRTDAESVMNCCDIGVLSTFTEGFPNALLEFMALEKPVVATNTGGVSDLVDEDVSGFLIEKRNQIQLTEKIRTLLDNKELRVTMGMKGKEKVMNNFTMEVMTQKYLNLYEKNGK